MIAALVGLGLVVVAVGLRRRFVVIRVRGHSMTPTYRDGQRVVALRIAGARCRTGDVVVFTVANHDLGHLVKRIAAAPGEPVPDWARPALGRDRVPAGQVVVAGDGARSVDSRQLGFVDLRTLVGVVARG